MKSIKSILLFYPEYLRVISKKSSKWFQHQYASKFSAPIPQEDTPGDTHALKVKVKLSL
jgi:hypothetical protein